MSVSEPTTAEAAAAGPGPGPDWGERARGAGGALLGQREFVILVFLLVICTAIGIARPTFFGPSNLLAMGRQMAEVAVMAVGATFLITSRELDLSVGSVYGFCTLLMAALALNTGLDLWLGLAVSLAVAALLGLVNGIITTRGHIPTFIVTLGMLYIVRGAALVMSAYPIARIEHASFYDVLAGDLFGVPVQIFWMLSIVVGGTLVFRRTTFGYQVRATGSNEAAARLAGIPVDRVKLACFVLSSTLAAFAGALSFAHLTSAAPTGGSGDELEVIAAVVIGGTSLFGGQGTIVGTFLGAALLTVVRNGLVQIGGEGRLQEAFLGGIIILAVLIHHNVGRRR